MIGCNNLNKEHNKCTPISAYVPCTFISDNKVYVCMCIIVICMKELRNIFKLLVSWIIGFIGIYLCSSVIYLIYIL